MLRYTRNGLASTGSSQPYCLESKESGPYFPVAETVRVDESTLRILRKRPGAGPSHHRRQNIIEKLMCLPTIEEVEPEEDLTADIGVQCIFEQNVHSRDKGSEAAANLRTELSGRCTPPLVRATLENNIPKLFRLLFSNEHFTLVSSLLRPF